MWIITLILAPVYTYLIYRKGYERFFKVFIILPILVLNAIVLFSYLLLPQLMPITRDVANAVNLAFALSYFLALVFSKKKR